MEVIDSVEQNYRTVVHSANQMGKTRTAAATAIYFFCSRSPARVITTSSSASQLEMILWTEIRNLISKSRVPLPIQMNHLHLRKFDKDGKFLDLDYCIGAVTNSVESFQGHHLPRDKPRVLGIFEEASGIPSEFVEAAESWAHRLLVIGNPLNIDTWFYHRCREGNVPDPSGESQFLNRVIHFDGLDSPNVRVGLEYERRGIKKSPPVLIPGLLTLAEYRQREAMWDAVQRHTRLRGMFWEGQDSLMFPMSWLDLSQALFNLLTLSRRARAGGLDVAAGGGDKTVWTIVDEFGVIRILALDTPDTMEIVSRTISLLNDYNLPANALAIDAGGGGKQIYDRLSELGHTCRLVSFGEVAGSGISDRNEAVRLKKSYSNRRSELFGELRSMMSPELNPQGFAIPPDAYELRQDLACLPLKYGTDGRMFLIPKQAKRPGEDSISKRLGRSPDFGDSLALAVWMLNNRNRFVELSLDEGKWKALEEKQDRMARLLAERLGS